MPTIEQEFVIQIDRTVDTEFTFEQICELEPRVGALYAEIESLIDDPLRVYFCANELWYQHGGYKMQLFGLVGYYAEVEVLQSHQAYEVAYWTLYNALPQCRNCGCLPVLPRSDVGL